MTDSDFVQTQSDNLPKIDTFMMSEYFASNLDFTSAEIKGVKTARLPQMFQNKSTIPIPEKLLLNFNPYEILEPQKSALSGPKVEKLIDIDDSLSVTDIDSSLLDQKKEYDLVDLLQNIYVTPGLVKKNIKSNEHNLISGFDSIEFRNFCDEFESRGKSVCTKGVEEKPAQSVAYVKLTNESKVLTPEVQDDSDTEDLIEEILVKKTIEKQILEKTNSSKTTATSQLKKINLDVAEELPKLKILKTPQILELPVPKTVQYKTNDLKIDQIPTCSKNIHTDTASPNKYASLQLNNHPTSFCKTDNYQNLIMDRHQYSSFDFQVVPIRKDEKLYRKYRILKPESQTCNVTKGANLDEKVIVLPQIMARIYARMAYLSDQSSVENKPRCEVPKTLQNNSNVCGINQIKVPTVSKNFIKPIDSKTDYSSPKIINNPSIVSKTDKSNFYLNGSINNFTDFKVIPIKKDEKAYKTHRITKPLSQTRNFTKGPDLEEKKIIIPQIMARMNARKAYLELQYKKEACIKKKLILDGSKNEVDYKTRLEELEKNSATANLVGIAPKIEKSSQNQPLKDTKKCCNCSCEAKKSPVQEIKCSVSDPDRIDHFILMKDCNQERLKALKVGQKFAKFVQEGK